MFEAFNRIVEPRSDRAGFPEAGDILGAVAEHFGQDFVGMLAAAG